MHRHSLLFQRKREAIFEVLGRKCAACGCEENLSFDVIVPQRDPKAHHGCMSSNMRMRFYCQMLAAGNLQVLCDKCNTRKCRGTTRFIIPLLNGKPSRDLVPVQPF